MPKTLHIDVTLSEEQVARLEVARRFYSEDPQFGITEESSLEDVYEMMADDGTKRLTNHLMKEGILSELTVS